MGKIPNAGSFGSWNSYRVSQKAPTKTQPQLLLVLTLLLKKVSDSPSSLPQFTFSLSHYAFWDQFLNKLFAPKFLSWGLLFFLPNINVHLIHFLKSLQCYSSGDTRLIIEEQVSAT